MLEVSCFGSQVSEVQWSQQPGLVESAGKLNSGDTGMSLKRAKVGMAR